MARLGTIFVEFEDYPNAERYLNRLNQEFPDHRALKQAMFNLGKVQFEVGKRKEAAEAFRKILAEAAEQSAGNLNFISRAFVASDQADLALLATEELLRRSESVEHPDYEKLAGRTRESLLFRAGEAALAANKPRKTVEYLNRLLKDNPKTANFFRAKISLAKAKRQLAPPDLVGGLIDLNDVRKFAQDDVLINETIVEFANNVLSEPGEANVRRALGQLGQLVLVVDGKVQLLADEAKTENQPFIEEGIYLAAKAYGLLGDRDSQELMKKEYRRRFPQGRFSAQL